MTAFGDSDPITRGADRFLQGMIPGAAGQPHRTIEGAGHFIQEDRGEGKGRAEVLERELERTLDAELCTQRCIARGDAMVATRSLSPLHTEYGGTMLLLLFKQRLMQLGDFLGGELDHFAVVGQ